MTRYILKRILMLIPIMLCVILIVYALLYTTVGARKNALSSYGGGDWLDTVFEKLGIEETFVSRYIRYCYKVFFKFDFGVQDGRTVTSDIRYRMTLTLRLTMWGFAGTLIFGVGIGLFAALRQGSWAENAVMAFITFLSSIPSYTLALMLVLLFALHLNILPAFGFTRPGSMIMPSLTVAIGGIASTARLTRSSVVEILDQTYVTALHAKGLGKRSIIFVHVLKNAMVPVVSNLTIVMSQMLCGAIVVERFFSLPGLGTMLLTAVTSRNQTNLLAASVIIAFMLVSVNILADIIYTFLNPQMRTQFLSSGKKGGAAE